MTKRVNLQDKPLVKNLEEADATLARIAELGRRITLINTALNDDVAKLQLAANEQLSPLTGEKELLERSLYLFMDTHKNDLFNDKQRSRNLSFGTIGIHSLPGELVTIGNTTLSRVLELLQEKGLKQYIRIKPEVNKEALAGADPELLKSVRCRIKGGEKPYYRLADHAGQGGSA